MSQQGPIIVVSTAERPSFVNALDEAKMFPVIDAAWADAAHAIEQLRPAAVLLAMSESDERRLEVLAKQIGARQPYLPLIAIDPKTSLPPNVLPFSQTKGHSDRLAARLRAALRVRALHATVMRRLDGDPDTHTTLPDTDPVRDATVLLIGRGSAYPALSVSLGERMGVVGALSIEAAAKHLNLLEIDGIVLGEGFSARVVDAFLTVLSEDARFRNLPVVVTSERLTPAYDLPNLEIISGEPERIAANALPLIRQHVFEVHLGRTLRAIDAGGLLDSRTGLLTSAAFNRDFATSVYQTLSRGGGLSVARFAFDPARERAQLDGARIISRLMRQMDFGAVQDDGSVIVAFSETDLRTAHMIARRLASVMRHTSYGNRDARSEPVVTLATMLPSDSAKSLLARLYEESRRAAS
ncbi:MAG: GGDEF domain-containing protein [Bradyrhizobium sp.]|uniref:GGDEF domain-containing protein n=1 Tax=Bradyrhizobium sp. TaxID=376 RepID=UPI0011F76D0C|nr:GGDEF domain-containing protein [Bradyrhizobium sp.]THD62685.1 MAG: GGDEF domain-containing protein [Bradyrhizobium sp.]